MKKLILFWLIYSALLPAQGVVARRRVVAAAGTVVTFGSNGGSARATNNSTVTLTSAAIASCANELGIVDVAWGNAPTGLSVSSVTWGGVAMTAAGAVAQSGALTGTQVFYLAAPATGTPNIVVTLSGTETYDLFVDAMTYCGVNQSAPVRPSSYITNATSSGNPLAVTITSATGDMTHSSTYNATGVQTSSQTRRTNGTTGSRIGFGTDDAAGAASVAHSWNYGSNSNAAVAGFSIQHN